MKNNQHSHSKKTAMTKPVNLAKNIFSIALVFVIFCHFSVAEAKADAHNNDVRYEDARWYFGLAGAANLNFYEGTTHRLTDDLLLPATFHDGFGFKPYAAALVEYHFNNMWGITLNLGYDGRGGMFDKVMSPCNLESELETNLSYFVIEPALRFTPFQSGFHVFAGPRFSLNLQNEFIYKREIQHSSPVQHMEVEDEWSELNSSLISFQIGAGYDFMLSSPSSQMKYVLTPFVSFHPYFGQVPRDIETWSITTVRAGVALKFGRGTPVTVPDPTPEPVVEEEVAVEPEEPVITEPPVTFAAIAPLTEASLTSNEIYPLRNYVFFDEGNTSLPGRYQQLSRGEAQRFSEDDLINHSGIRRDNHRQNQLAIYYNILNIIGDRMRNNPGTTITLNGSSAGQGQNTGLQQAESVKNYLVSVFGIDAQRITTRGSEWPETRSFRHDQQTDANLRLDSDRRVEILTANKELLMADEGRLSGTLKPVMIAWADINKQRDHITFSLTNAERYMKEWSVVLIDPNGREFEYGPFRTAREQVPAAEVLERGAVGTYRAVMTGVSLEDLEFSREQTINLSPELVAEDNVVHFSILFDIGMAETPRVYENYILDQLVPFIPENANIIIHGHTDLIGSYSYNQALSQRRAQRAKDLIQGALRSHGITNVNFEVYGLGEYMEDTPFPNQLPEQRFYNRTVIIDIAPQ